VEGAESRFATASGAFVNQQQQDASRIVDDIIGSLQSDCERRHAKIMLSARADASFLLYYSEPGTMITVRT
jgi:hypothetical protein